MSTADEVPAVAASAQTGASGSSFYAGMRVLPKAERAAMFAIYAFCRQVDDIADDLEGSVEDRRAGLEAWRAGVDRLYSDQPAGRAGFLLPHVRRFGLREADFVSVIDGMEMDVDQDIRAPDLETLDLYCDRVASSVGRLSVRVFGMDERPGVELAHHLGRALQLTNILRDLDEDAEEDKFDLANGGNDYTYDDDGDIAESLHTRWCQTHDPGGDEDGNGSGCLNGTSVNVGRIDRV